MDQESERDYFLKRAVIERVAAAVAISRAAKAIHLEMAQRYELLAMEAEQPAWAAKPAGNHASQ